MLRTALICLLISFSTPALAIYKCKSGDRIVYSDQPCADGEVLSITAPTPGETAKAMQRTAEEQKRLKRLENEHRKQEAREEKERQRAAHTYAARQKRCTSLARRMQWANQDAAAATGKANERAKLKAQRVAQQFEDECRK
jgi:hypothetical protein